MQKIITSLLGIILLSLPAKANNIERILSKQHINPSAVSISIKNVDTGENVYNLNEKTPRQPASTLKIITTAAVLDTLGNDYKFSTKLYKSTNNDLYLKLGADPFLKSSDLKTLIEAAKSKNIIPRTFYIDSSIFDNTEWGEGWQWDDDLNPLMPKFSAYNLDKNLINIELTPQKNGMSPNIIVKPYYPITIMNMVKTDYIEKNNIKLERNNSISPNIINASGTISKQTLIRVPINNPKIYFNLRLRDAIRNRKFTYYDEFKNGILPNKNIYLVSEINNNITDAITEVLKNSNNFVAETLFKLAGAKYANTTGNIENSEKMLSSYLNKLEINTEDIRVVDGSGVSKNNIVTADFMTDFLLKFSKAENYGEFINYLPTPGEGTLKNRMLYFKGNMRAKTGTLSNTSSITGYLTGRSGKKYVFSIIIQDAKTLDSDKKNIEELILREIYTN